MMYSLVSEKSTLYMCIFNAHSYLHGLKTELLFKILFLEKNVAPKTS